MCLEALILAAVLSQLADPVTPARDRTALRFFLLQLRLRPEPVGVENEDRA